MNISEQALAVLKQRYFHEGEDAEAMFWRVANYLSGGDTEKAERYFEVMSALDFLPNSPTLMNAGKEGKAAQLSACFVLPIGDSMEFIMETLKNAALIHKSGGGVGINFSTLRPEGAKVGTTVGVASGPVSFMELFDTMTDVVQQGGMRRGANMGILDVIHPDILKFIHAKDSGTKLQNFNLSVGMSDEFMQKVVDGTLNEEESTIWHSIINSAWRTGDPGLVFLDEHERHNPTPELGRIVSTNPCGEVGMLPYEACNLGSINLSHFVKDGEVDYERMSPVIRTAVDLLNDVIVHNHYPLPEVAEAVNKTKKIGLGIMGWADMLYMMGIRYGTPESLELAENVMMFIKDVATAHSNGRNATVTCIAPTGTISIIADCSGGVEPIFALEYDRKAFAKEGDAAQILHFVNPEYQKSRELNDGRIDKGVFVTAHEVTTEEHIKMQAAFQKYVDLAVSKTINMPHNATREDVWDAYVLAWKLKCKGITVYRDGCRSEQVLTASGEKCPECGSEKVVHEAGCKRCVDCGWSPCAV